MKKFLGFWLNSIGLVNCYDNNIFGQARKKVNRY